MRAVLAILLIVLLVFPLALAALSLLAVSSWAVDANFYANALTNPKVYESLLSDEMLTQITRQMFGASSQVDAPALREFAKAFMSADFMKMQVVNAVHSVFDYLNGRSAALDIKLDLKPMKATLSGEQQSESLLTLAAALPECKEGQVVRPKSLGFYVCRPSFLKTDDFLVHYLLPSIEDFLPKIPDEIAITPPGLTTQDSEQWRVWIPGGSLQNALLLALGLLSVAVLGFWLLAGLIASSAWSVRLRWMGFALFIPALLVFIVGLLTMQAGFVTPYVNLGLTRSGLEAQLPFAREAVLSVTEAALPRISTGFMMVGGIASAVALAFIFWGISIRPKTKKENAPVEVEK